MEAKMTIQAIEQARIKFGLNLLEVTVIKLAVANKLEDGDEFSKRKLPQIYEKLGISTIEELTRFAIDNKLTIGS